VNGQWDIPRLRTALETIVSGRTTIEAASLLNWAVRFSMDCRRDVR
jgi:hypothetical protein